MLILARKKGEELVLGDNIRIVIHRVRGSSVRIGIDAPQDVRILRGELLPLRGNNFDEVALPMLALAGAIG